MQRSSMQSALRSMLDGLEGRPFGADTFVEAGPGKTLCGFNKRIDRSLKSMNVENLETLEKTLDYFKEVR